MKEKHFVDSHKGSNALVILGIMAWHDAWDNNTAWMYLALHGTYGVLWVLKSRNFGDRQWETPVRLPYASVIWASLSLYWVGPWIIASQDVRAPAWYLAMCAVLWGLGVFFHFASDMQKHMHMKLAPGTLMTDGLWSRCRNPNYFGELLVYLGFTLLAMHWAPLLVLGAFMTAVWLPRMLRKDRSLSRYADFAAWTKRSALFIPYVI